MSFFQLLETGRKEIPLVALCGACGIYKKCESPRMPVGGKGKRRILVVGEAPGCIAGDSLIDTAFRDKSIYPNGIPIKDLVGRKNFYTYSFDVKKQKLVLGKVKRVWKTGRKKVYKVTYEWKYAKDSEVVTLRNSVLVTSNHPFLIKRPIDHDPFKGKHCTSDYLSIDDGLSVGHSLQPFHRIFATGYSRVGPFSKSMVKESRFLLSCKLGRSLKNDEECHHKDENKLNDKATNIENLSKVEHARRHSKKRNPMDDPDARKSHKIALSKQSYRDKISDKLKEHLSDPTNYKNRVEQIHKQAGQTSLTLKYKYKNPEFYFNYLLGCLKRFPRLNMDWVKSKFNERFPGENLPIDNHKIISIEYAGYQDVYDMEVEKYHNFAVNGVFVHNSTEDEQNIQFAGKAGRKLKEVMGQYDCDLFRDCWVTNALICRPTTPAGNNRTPDSNEIGYCRPNLIKTIKTLKPDVIIPLGSVALESLMGWLWRDEVGGVAKWLGCKIPSQDLNAWICPNFHPSFLLHKENPVAELYFARYLKEALAIRGKPWDKVPSYKGMIIKVFDDEDAARIIQKHFINSNKPVAFDYETNCLKPEFAGTEIVCCSMSNGDKTIAYPWYGKAIKATRRFLLSPVPKIAANMKYEHRWTMNKLGIEVVNWDWDTMQAAHWLDNRPGITSLKFQALALLGMGPYDEELTPYLKDRGDGSHLNRIREIPMEKLLLYCGLDSLLEILVALKQKGTSNVNSR